MSNELKKQDLDAWLDSVDYSALNTYVPSEFALVFMNFIKLVNGEQGESHKTPPVHLKMLDKISANQSKLIANLCFRGAAKTTLFMEYFSLFLGVFNTLPGFGQVEGMIYVSDSMDNGVKSARKNIEFRYNNSQFLQEYIPEATFTDNYIEFVNKQGKRLGIKMFGAKALALDTVLYLASGDVTDIGSCSVGDVIIGADGKPTTITKKSEVFHKPMYELVLDDGRTLKVSEDHLNQVHVKRFKSSKTFSSHTFEEKTLTTLELLEEPLYVTDSNGSSRPLVWIDNVKPMEFVENRNLLIDPYTVGALLGDGSMNPKATGNAPVVLTAHKDDWPTYEKNIPYLLGKPYQKDNTISRTVIGINHLIALYGLNKHGDCKEIPEDFLLSSIDQRLALLQGLMDTDGSISKDGKPSFSSNSRKLVEGVMWLVRSLGGTARWVSTGKPMHFRTLVQLDMPLFRLLRKTSRQTPNRNNMVSISEIRSIPMEPSQCIAVDNEEHQFVAGIDLVRTHNTGLRGTKIFGKRPVLAILDDLVSDDDSKSKASMQTIKDTVYKGVFHALDPTRRKVVFNGTPFNKEDILIEAVESGAWDVNVWPVCERFPCSKEEFVGAWEDRFSYEFIKDQYEMAEKTGKLSAFYQELMLRITSEDERLVQDAEIRWYSRTNLMKNLGHFNFYITTDLATSAKEVADYSVVSVWAYNSNGDWFWVDGIAKKQLISKTWDDLFRLISIYKPQAVGIEINGQQQSYISYLQREMMVRNVWFNFASSGKNGEPGIRSQGDKLSRFNMVVPWFKMGKMYFPEEMKESGIMRLFMEQIRLVTQSGIKGKDDCIDTISQLGMLNPWRPSEAMPLRQGDGGVWEPDEEEDSPSALNSYIV